MPLPQPDREGLLAPQGMLRKMGRQTVPGFLDLLGKFGDSFQYHGCANYLSSFRDNPKSPQAL